MLYDAHFEPNGKAIVTFNNDRQTLAFRDAIDSYTFPRRRLRATVVSVPPLFRLTYYACIADQLF